jgi:hypothetical protein
MSLLVILFANNPIIHDQTAQKGLFSRLSLKTVYQISSMEAAVAAFYVYL